MTLLVPYDGSELASAALERATEFADYRDEPVVAVTVVPDDEEFARERGWIGPDEPLDADALCAEFEAQVHDVDEAVDYRCEQPEVTDALGATTVHDITRTIRVVADQLDVSTVFIGSENAGRVSLGVNSVGVPISEDPRYDVHIVRHAD